MTMSYDSCQTFYGAWARQLQREFTDICYRYSLPLLSPVVEITDALKMFGSWRPATRTIGISSHLIRNYSWDTTINVFKHEMAHQICSEMFGDHGRPHAGEFLRACNLLGLPPEYCRATGNFSDLQPEGAAGKQDCDTRRKLLERIRKVLAMADSANEHEAMTAMELAGRIMEKHALDGLVGDEAEEVTYRIISTGKKRIDSSQRAIISILSRYFKVTVIRSQLYDPGLDEVHKTFEIFGRRDNVEVAEHCFHFLEKRLAYLWRIHRVNCIDTGRNARKSYYLGVLHGFTDNLSRENRQETAEDCNEKPCRIPALSVHHLSCEVDLRVQACIQKRYPRLKTLKSARQSISAAVYTKGREAGREIIFSKALQQDQNQNSQKLLPNYSLV